MRTRNKKKQVWLSEYEAAELAEKAKRTRLKEATLMRMLISGYHPPEAPSDEFHDDMNRLLDAAERFYSLAERKTERETRELLKAAYAEIRVLRMKILQKYLIGERVDI